MRWVSAVSLVLAACSGRVADSGRRVFADDSGVGSGTDGGRGLRDGSAAPGPARDAHGAVPPDAARSLDARVSTGAAFTPPTDPLWTGPGNIFWIATAEDVLYWALSDDFSCYSGGSCASSADSTPVHVYRLAPGAAAPEQRTFAAGVRYSRATRDWSLHVSQSVLLPRLTLRAIPWTGDPQSALTEDISFYAFDGMDLYLGDPACSLGADACGDGGLSTFMRVGPASTFAHDAKRVDIGGLQAANIRGFGGVLGGYLYVAGDALRRAPKGGGEFLPRTRFERGVTDFLAGDTYLYYVFSDSAGTVKIVAADNGGYLAVSISEAPGGDIRSMQLLEKQVCFVQQEKVNDTEGVYYCAPFNGGTPTAQLSGKKVADATLLGGHVIEVVKHELPHDGFGQQTVSYLVRH
jgi:hypothetical protein